MLLVPFNCCLVQAHQDYALYRESPTNVNEIVVTNGVLTRYSRLAVIHTDHCSHSAPARRAQIASMSQELQD
ncbi:hypothetical protein TSMEX_006697 [Taenia solium]|eukprot:TsM_001016300 transcript=TsM_001016300 gene=TsM_001016300